MNEEGRDLYTVMAAKMFGVPYEEVTNEQRIQAKEKVLHTLYSRDTEPMAETLGVNSDEFKHKR